MKPLLISASICVSAVTCTPALAAPDFGAGFVAGSIVALVLSKSSEGIRSEPVEAKGTVYFPLMPVIKAKYPSGGAIVPVGSVTSALRPSVSEQKSDAIK